MYICPFLTPSHPSPPKMYWVPPWGWAPSWVCWVFMSYKFTCKCKNIYDSGIVSGHMCRNNRVLLDEEFISLPWQSGCSLCLRAVVSALLALHAFSSLSRKSQWENRDFSFSSCWRRVLFAASTWSYKVFQFLKPLDSTATSGTVPYNLLPQMTDCWELGLRHPELYNLLP